MTSRCLLLTAQNALVFILFSYTLVVSAFIGAESRNYLVLFGGLLLFLFKFSLDRQILWAFSLLLIMTMQSLFVDGIEKLGSVALTCVYALGYFALSHLLQCIQHKKDCVQNMMRKILYTFAILSVG